MPNLGFDSEKPLEIIYLSTSLLQFAERDSRFYRFPDHYERLKDSIKSHGVMVPLTVTESKDKHRFVVMDGTTRLKVCLDLAINEVPCLILSCVSRIDFLVLRNVQNIQRRNYDPVGTAADMQELHKVHELSYSSIGSLYSVSKAWVAKLMSLNRCSPEIRIRVARGELSVNDAYQFERIDRIRLPDGTVPERDSASPVKCRGCNRKLQYYEYYEKILLCSTCLSVCRTALKAQKRKVQKEPVDTAQKRLPE